MPWIGSRGEREAGSVSSPDTRDEMLAKPAPARLKLVFFNLEADPPDNDTTALGTNGVLSLVAGHVADIDITQAFGQRDRPGRLQSGEGRRGQVLHQVHGMESREMERNFGPRLPGQPAAHASYLVPLVIQAGDDQGDDLEPSPAFGDEADGFQNGLEPPAGHLGV